MPTLYQKTEDLSACLPIYPLCHWSWRLGRKGSFEFKAPHNLQHNGAIFFVASPEYHVSVNKSELEITVLLCAYEMLLFLFLSLTDTHTLIHTATQLWLMAENTHWWIHQPLFSAIVTFDDGFFFILCFPDGLSLWVSAVMVLCGWSTLEPPSSNIYLPGNGELVASSRNSTSQLPRLIATVLYCPKYNSES